MIAENSDILHDQLKKVIGLTKIIGTGETVVPLTQRKLPFCSGSAVMTKSLPCPKVSLSSQKLRFYPGRYAAWKA